MKTLGHTKLFAIATMLLVAFFYGCCDSSYKATENRQSFKNEPIYTNNNLAFEGIQILTIDSCEYVWCRLGYAGGLTHKGNCKYCAERAKQNHP